MSNASSYTPAITFNQRFEKLLFQPIDNAPIVIFRMLFGLLIAIECYGSIGTGWVRRVLVEPTFTFTMPGFEWLQPLPGDGMYYYFAVMGSMGVLICLGYYYRFAMLTFAVMWSGVYFMQTTSYNNHYYLLMIISYVMFLLPAHTYASLDVIRKPSIKTLTMPRWVSLTMILHMAIVYFFATKAKFYPDWLDGTFTRILFTGRAYLEIFGDLFKQPWFHLFIAYSGIAFDGLVVPMLLWKPTRIFAFIASLFFHIFNSITLRIGIFPYFALSFGLFFFEPAKLKKLFLWKKPFSDVQSMPLDFRYKNILIYVLIPYFILQIALPLRHHFIEGNVFWTEEGHKHSWRMMLRSRSGTIKFMVENKATGEREKYDLVSKVSKKQIKNVSNKPHSIWQMAQRIKKEYTAEGIDVAVYAECRVSLNGRKSKPFIDSEIDLSTVKFNVWKHNEWILLYDKEEIFEK